MRYFYQSNRGKSWATYIGIQAACGRYLFNLDSDDCFLPDKLQQVVTVFESDPQINHVIHPAIYWHIADNRCEPEKIPSRIRCEQKIPGRQLLRICYRQERFFGGGSTFAARTAILKSITIVPEIYSYIDEYLALYTMNQPGYSYVLRQPLSLYRLHGNNISQKVFTHHGLERELGGVQAIQQQLLSGDYPHDLQIIYGLKTKVYSIIAREFRGHNRTREVVDLWRYIWRYRTVFGRDFCHILAHYWIWPRCLPLPLLHLLRSLRRRKKARLVSAPTILNASNRRLTLAVIIPTYHRPHDLDRCLKGLSQQQRPPDEIIVVRHVSDDHARRSIAAWPQLPLKTGIVAGGGQVAALAEGLRGANADIIVFTDDDTSARRDWLERIEAIFQSDSHIGAVGGRDYCYWEGCRQEGSQALVGKITWYGRIIGNHSLASGPLREVDHLKGANMAFRRQALAGVTFAGLCGDGAQYRNDMGLSLAVKAAGWKLVFDPALAIDHYLGCRHEADQRQANNLSAIRNGAHNETYLCWRYLPRLQKLTTLVYALLIGNSFLPGIAQWLRLILAAAPAANARLCACITGRWTGLRQGSITSIAPMPGTIAPTME